MVERADVPVRYDHVERPRQSSSIRSRKLVAVLAAACVCVISFLPTAKKRILHTMGPLHPVGHILAFGLVAFSSLRAVNSPRSRLALLIATILLGASLEAVQHILYPGEALEWADIACDSAGVVLGTFVWLAAQHLSRSN